MIWEDRSKADALQGQFYTRPVKGVRVFLFFHNIRYFDLCHVDRHSRCCGFLCCGAPHDGTAVQAQLRHDLFCTREERISDIKYIDLCYTV